MVSRVLRLAMVALLIVTAGSTGAVSFAEASEAGGLPALAARVAALEQIASTLKSQVSTLQSQIVSLQSSNTSLLSALNAEIANRQSADTSLQSAITQEASTRKSQDDALKASIDSASSKGFFSSKGVSDLAFGGAATVGTLGPLAAGSYLVTAVATVQNLSHSANWFCTLHLVNANESIGSTGVDTDTSPGPVGGSNNAVITTLLTLGAQDTITMVCQNSESVTNSQVFNTKITAVTIGSASFTATP